MRELILSRLWLGNQGDLLDPAAIERAEIRAIVHVAMEERLPDLSRELLRAHVPLVDGANPPAMIEAALDLVTLLLRRRVKTLVCCSGGMSRSPAIAAGAIAVAQGRDPEQCLRGIIDGEPCDLSSGLWHSVLQAVARRRSA